MQRSFTICTAKFRLLALFVTVLLLGCATVQLPTQRFSQAQIPAPQLQLQGDTLSIKLRNTNRSPIRFSMASENEALGRAFNEMGSVTLAAQLDTIVRLAGFHNLDENAQLSYSWSLGDLEHSVKPIALAYPFPKGNSYKVIQGNNGSFSHNTDWSRYAIDFDLKASDTISAAHDGFVVGVVQGYQHGGPEKKWKPYGNFITLYHPEAGIYTQYVHLQHNGSLVELGDWVKKGQPIGLSGMTGQTTVVHLHFNYLVPADTPDGLKSIPFTFEDGTRSEELTRGEVVLSE